MSHLKYIYGITAKNKYLYTEALTHSRQLFLHTYRHVEHSSCTYRYIYDRLFYVATMSIKICRKQHLRKSCNAKWRELTGTTEWILLKINEII